MEAGVQIIRVYDPARTPASWAEIILPGQFVAFPSDGPSGVPCDVAGRPSGDPLDGVCLLFDTLLEAEAWCRKAAADVPRLRLDVFDAEGRVNPPLLTIVHPSREVSLDTHPAGLRRRRALGWVLIAIGAGLIVFAYRERHGAGEIDIDIIFPAIVGINMVLFGGRLLWMNLIVRETERARAARVADQTRPTRPPAR